MNGRYPEIIRIYHFWPNFFQNFHQFKAFVGLSDCRIIATAPAQYKCPVCAKKLKTISGFRGHSEKQHGQNLRASDHHRIASTPDAEPVITSTSAMSFTDQSFGNVFSASLASTLTNITNDPFISNPDEMRTLCSVVQGSTDINNFLYQIFAI
jgi:hypothetical protein